MNVTLGRALVALVVGIVAATASVSLLTGNPVASYVFNRNFAIGTAGMLVGVVLIWYQRPDPDADPQPDADPEGEEESSA